MSSEQQTSSYASLVDYMPTAVLEMRSGHSHGPPPLSPAPPRVRGSEINAAHAFYYDGRATVTAGRGGGSLSARATIARGGAPGWVLSSLVR